MGLSKNPSTQKYTDSVILGFHEFSGYTLNEDTEVAMRGYLANNQGGRHGKFVYSIYLLKRSDLASVLRKDSATVSAELRIAQMKIRFDGITPRYYGWISRDRGRCPHSI